MTAKEHIDSVYACSMYGSPGLFDIKDVTEFMESYANEELAALKAENERLKEALRGIEPFAKEVIARQKNESVFGYNGETLTLSQLKKILESIKV